MLYDADMTESRGPIWIAPLLGGGLALLTQVALGWRVGADLHTFFGGVVIATLVASPLVAIGESIGERLLLIVAVSLGVAVGWWLEASHEKLTGSIWTQCWLIVLAWTLSVVGVSSMLTRILRQPTFGSAGTTLLALMWLASPIWLGMHAANVVKFHPLFAMNVPLINLGLWTEQPIEYKYLFSLGQDVPYLLPASIVPMTVLHVAIGLSSLAAGFSPLVFWKKRNQRAEARG